MRKKKRKMKIKENKINHNNDTNISDDSDIE